MLLTKKTIKTNQPKTQQSNKKKKATQKTTTTKATTRHRTKTLLAFVCPVDPEPSELDCVKGFTSSALHKPISIARYHTIKNK